MCDHLNNGGGIEKIHRSESLLFVVRSAWHKYRLALEEENRREKLERDKIPYSGHGSWPLYIESTQKLLKERTLLLTTKI